MRTLFNIDPETETVALDQEWILMIPEFAKLLKADKGSSKDYRGEKKLLARKQFTFIYFMLDFRSPIIEWSLAERKPEALRYASLTEDDINEDVEAAGKHYDKLLLGCARSLKTLRTMESSLDTADAYFEKVNFSSVDPSTGKPIYTMKEFLSNMSLIEPAYASLEAFRKRVYAELRQDGPGVRGDKRLGDKEGTRGEWNEGGKPEKSKRTMVDLQDLATSITSKFDEHYTDLDDDADTLDGANLNPDNEEEESE